MASRIRLVQSRVSSAEGQYTRRHAAIPSTSASTIQNDNPSNAGSSTSRTTHFGFREIPEEQKEALVGGVFSSVASKYDLMNDSMSLGIHRLWKDSFVSAMLPRLPPSIHQNTGAPNPTIKGLDVAGGTGDIAFRLLDRARERFGNRELEVEIVDLNEGMLREGEKRVAKTMYFNSECTFLGIMRCELIGLAPQITFTHGNAQTLPKHIADNSIDIYTIAFGIRNCTSLPAVLSEAYRVLKPGGKIGVLEFGKVRNALLRQVYRQYSFQVIPILGRVLAGDSESYQYLVESIERFPSQSDFAKLVQEAGFHTGVMREGKGGAWTDFTGGIATMWMGMKA